jgi:TonB-linked SusC/RagA family outer membrane protein
LYLIEKKNIESKKVPILSKKLTGLVTDEKGDPIIGASIIEISTNKGTVTDINGQFSLETANTGQIKVSYIGYESQTVAISGKSSLKISLSQSLRNLEEIVVVGFGTQKKLNLTGSVSTINMEKTIQNRPVTSISSALQGTLPGVQLSGNSGEPGATWNLNVRGMGSINGGSPLVLVDNVPMDINLLNPSDIESVTVLKDAAASAIYGSQAAFGVILVTTKKGKKNEKLKFNYSTNISFNNPQRIPQRATALQQVQAYKDQGFVDFWLGENVDIWIDLLKKYDANPSAYPANGIAYVGNSTTPYFLKSTDVYKDMLDKFGFQQKHDISVSGGSEKLAFRLSGSLQNQDGVLYTNKDSYKQYNLNSYVSADVAKWLTIQVSTLISNSEKKDPYLSSMGGLNVWGMASNLPNYFPVGTAVVDGTTYQYDNPKGLLTVTEPQRAIRNATNLSGKVILTPFKGLTVVGEYAYNSYYDNAFVFNKRVTLKDALAGGKRVKTNPTVDEYENIIGPYHDQTVNLYATYQQVYGKHDLKLTFGGNSQYTYYQILESKKLQMLNPELPSIVGGLGASTSYDGFDEYASQGLFYRFNYSYKDKYLFEANGRYDGSSKFPASDRYGFFPSFSAAWRLTEEKFMQSLKPIFSNIKIRGSWGSIGNQNIRSYQYLPTMNTITSNWIVDGLNKYSLSTPSLVRGNFTWEEVRTKNIGLDLGIFDNKLNISLDNYLRETLNMLGPGASYPGVLGTGAPLQNAANLESNGWELQLSWNDKIGEVSYGVGLNISDARTKITKYKNDVGALWDYYEGKEIGEIWGYETDRLYTVDDFVDGSLRTTSLGLLTGGTLKPGIPHFKDMYPNPGDVLYKNADADGIISPGASTLSDPGSRRAIGNDTPRYIYGINGNLAWKGFTFSFLLNGVMKRDIVMNDINHLFWPLADAWNTSLYTHQLNYWTPANTSAYYARSYPMTGSNTMVNRLPQTRYLQSGAYLDIKNITVSYQLPKNIVEKLSLESVNIFLGCENLWSFNSLPPGMHPDGVLRTGAATSSYVYGSSYPVMRMINTGINVKF